MSEETEETEETEILFDEREKLHRLLSLMMDEIEVHIEKVNNAQDAIGDTLIDDDNLPPLLKSGYSYLESVTILHTLQKMIKKSDLTAEAKQIFNIRQRQR